MTIRRRTVNPRRSAGLVAVTGLSTVAALHAAWAAGSLWPESDPDRLADLVVGHRPWPGPTTTWGVTALLAAAAGLTAAEAGLVRSPARARGVIGLGARTVAATLLIRGAGGMIASSAGLGRSTDVYRRWDLRLYSPLCLALGAAVLASTDKRRR